MRRLCNLEFASLSGEICPTGRLVHAGSAGTGNSLCDWTEVSRSHSRFGSRPASGTIGNELRYSWRWSHPTEGRNLQGHATVLAAQAVMKPYGGAVLRRSGVVKAHAVRETMGCHGQNELGFFLEPSVGTAGCGPACPVVWGGGAKNSPLTPAS